MFPKQITPFILIHPMPSVEVIQSKLEAMCITPITGLDWFSEGFAPPTPFSNDLTFTTQNATSGSLKRSERVLPNSVIKAAVDERVAQIEATEERKVGKKERNQIKEDTIDDLLPRAFTRERLSYFLCNKDFIFVYESSPKKAENLLAKLREALGGLAVSHIEANQSIHSLMTKWLLNGKCLGNFQFDNYALFENINKIRQQSKEQIKIKGKDLMKSEIQAHVRNGLQVKELGLIWRGQIAFVLTADFTLKRIQFLEVLQVEASEQGDDRPSLTYAEQEITSHNLSQLINELVELCGGLVQGN